MVYYIFSRDKKYQHHHQQWIYNKRINQERRAPIVMSENKGTIWMDGEFVPWADAKVHVLTHTLHYGMGVFEGLRAYKTDKGAAIFRLSSHIDRLFNSAHILSMSIPFDKETVNRTCLEAVSRNKLESAYIRPMCFYGPQSMGLHARDLQVQMMIAAWSWESYLGQKSLQQGIRIKTSSYTRHHVNITMCKAKANGNYLNSMLALQEARDCGYDEALLLDNQGYVAEGSGENIFIIRDGVLLTPDATSALAGITRDTIITLAKEKGLQVHEKNLTRDDVYIADEAFFTGTAAEITPIRELDKRVIGEGVRGPITEMLQTAYFDLVQGKDHNRSADWLSYVDEI